MFLIFLCDVLNEASARRVRLHLFLCHAVKGSVQPSLHALFILSTGPQETFNGLLPCFVPGGAVLRFRTNLFVMYDICIYHTGGCNNNETRMIDSRVFGSSSVCRWTGLWDDEAQS